jgi:uncharacterized membrane protein YhhN
MPAILFTLTCLAALIECAAVFKGWRTVEYIAKPGALVLLLLWLLVAGGAGGPLVWFGLAILFSLAGDVLLLFPNEERWFPFGLGAFLLAHAAYIIGLNSPLPAFTAMTFGVALMVIFSVLPLIRRILSGVQQKGLGQLFLPVRVYAAVISLMLFSALLTLFRMDWLSNPAYLVSMGAVLFVASDLLLAWNKFIAPVRHSHLLVMTSYYLGQIMLVAGAVGQFG